MTDNPNERIDDLYDGDDNLVKPITIDTILAELAESRSNSPAGASPERLAEWQTRRFATLRARAAAPTGFDDELPDEPLDNIAATRSAIDRLRGA